MRTLMALGMGCLFSTGTLAQKYGNTLLGVARHSCAEISFNTLPFSILSKNDFNQYFPQEVFNHTLSDKNGELVFLFQAYGYYNKELGYLKVAGTTKRLPYGPYETTNSGFLIPHPTKDTIVWTLHNTTLDGRYIAGGAPSLNGKKWVDHDILFSHIYTPGDSGRGLFIPDAITVARYMSPGFNIVRSHRLKNTFFCIGHERISEYYVTVPFSPNGVDTLNRQYFPQSRVFYQNLLYSGFDYYNKLVTSPQGDRVAFTYGFDDPDGLGWIELNRFDDSTGVLSDSINIPIKNLGNTMLEFSPDGSKLYYTYQNHLYQIDLDQVKSAGDAPAATTQIDTAGIYTSNIFLAPDCRIFMPGPSGLASPNCYVQYPNRPGRKCELVIETDSARMFFVSPHMHPKCYSFFDPKVNTLSDSFYTCLGTPASFDLQPCGMGKALWDFGDGDTSNQLYPTHSYASKGTYQVTLYLQTACADDTLYATVTVGDPPTVDLPGDTALCFGASLTLTPSFSHASRLEWNTGQTSHTLVVDTPGVYRVTAYGSGCMATDSIRVSFDTTQSFPQWNNKLSACKGDPVWVYAPSGWASYTWSNGTLGDSALMPDSGALYLTLTNSLGCSFTDSATVDRLALPQVGFTWKTNYPYYRTLFEPTVWTNATYHWQIGSNPADTFNVSNPMFDFPDTGNYQVTLTCTNNSGCSQSITQTVRIAQPTGLSKLPFSEKLKVWPNPTHGDLVLESTEPLQWITVYNANGQFVEKYNPKRASRILLSTDNWPAGLYLIVAETAKGISQMKVVKE